MIRLITITALKYEIDDSTRRYVIKKIGSLDRYLPRHARKSAAIEVKLRQVNRDHGNKYEAEAILTVPDRTLTAVDSTVNMLAAVDIVEAKLIVQARRYKQETVSHIGRRRLLSRLKQLRRAVDS